MMCSNNWSAIAVRMWIRRRKNSKKETGSERFGFKVSSKDKYNDIKKSRV